MLIEQINSASFSNGILRLETSTLNARGELVVTGSLEIPGPAVATIINGISQAAQDISSQLEGQQPEEDNKDKKGKTKSNQKDKN